MEEGQILMQTVNDHQVSEGVTCHGNLGWILTFAGYPALRKPAPKIHIRHNPSSYLPTCPAFPRLSAPLNFVPVQQEGFRREVALSSGDIGGRVPPPVRGSGLRAHRQQMLDNARVALSRRHHQRRPTEGIRRVHVGALGQAGA